MMTLNENETYSTDGPQCPYCNHMVEPDEPIHYDAVSYTKQKCQGCGNTFKVEVMHHVSWACERIKDATNSTSFAVIRRDGQVEGN
jgi:hypothetical protein